MKVKDLIKALQEFDPELLVVQSGYEGGLCSIRSPEEMKIHLNVNTQWWYGSHEECLHENCTQENLVSAIKI